MKIINLLPQSEQKEIQREMTFNLIRKFTLISVATYILLIGIYIGWRFYMQYTQSSLGEDIARASAAVKKTDNEKVQEQIKKANAAVSDYNKLRAENPAWSKVLEEFARIVPTDVLVTSFSANTKTGKIDIGGLGTSRESVLALRANIASSPMFKNINLPLENLQKPSYPAFAYTFYLSEGVLKQ